MADDSDPGTDSDLRRRAAWLLAMLAVVAVLFVIVMTWIIGGDSSNKSSNRPGALDSAINTSPSPSGSRHSKPPASRSGTSRTSVSPSSPTGTGGRASCPTSQTCVLAGDVGGGVAAINAYRTQHGKSAVSGSVSAAAQKCAQQNGNGCTGGWAETEVPKADGTSAVQKILPFAHLLDPMKSVEVGWAYDPGAKLYYFAIIRQV